MAPRASALTGGRGGGGGLAVGGVLGGGGGGRGKVAIISGKVEPTSVFEWENAAPPCELIVEMKWMFSSSQAGLISLTVTTRLKRVTCFIQKLFCVSIVKMIICSCM